MNVANRNAKRLVEDAEVLIKENRFPSAAGLAILSIEESGKIPILRGLALAKNEDDLQDSWKEYRTHTKKNALWIAPQLIQSGAHKHEDFKPLFEKSAEHPYLLDNIKQLGFYTDCLGKAHWTEPNSIIDNVLAKNLVQLAKVFLLNNEVSKKEIDLWIKHMKPVWKSNIELQEKAIIDWYKDMQEAGLKPPGDNEMRTFIEKGFRKA